MKAALLHGRGVKRIAQGSAAGNVGHEVVSNILCKRLGYRWLLFSRAAVGSDLLQQRESVERLSPTLDGVPFPGQVSECQIHHLEGGVGWKCSPRLDRFAQAHVQALDRCGGVDDLALAD